MCYVNCDHEDREGECRGKRYYYEGKMRLPCEIEEMEEEKNLKEEEDNDNE